MILTTTSSVEGREIREYKGIVFGEVITGTNFIKDIGASIRDFLGGRAEGYESELIKARQNALHEMQERAARLGADAVVGVKMDYESVGASNSILMVTCSGTAVNLRGPLKITFFEKFQETKSNNYIKVCDSRYLKCFLPS